MCVSNSPLSTDHHAHFLQPIRLQKLNVLLNKAQKLHSQMKLIMVFWQIAFVETRCEETGQDIFIYQGHSFVIAAVETEKQRLRNDSENAIYTQIKKRTLDKKWNKRVIC